MKNILIGVTVVCLVVGLTVLFIGATGMMFSPTTLTVGGVTYESYGLLNMSEHKSDKVRYEVPASRLVLSVVLIETVVVPLYIVGYDLWVPVAAATEPPH